MTNAYFDRYKNNRKQETARLQAELNKTANPREAFKDARYWEPTVDQMGNGSAIIRFLPAKTEDDDAYVTQYQHSFKGPTGLWYIENCRSMLGKEERDPVLEYIEPLWTGSDSDKKRASAMKKKTLFISNVVVIKDVKNPQNEGKVFLFRYGKKLFDKINKLMNPTDEMKELGKVPVDPYDLFEGVNLHLVVTKKDGFRNYDDSEFSAQGPIFKDEDKMAKLFDLMYDLKAEVAPEKVKSFADLEKRLYKTLGVSAEAQKIVTKPAASTKPASRPPVQEATVDDDESAEDVDALIDELTK